MRTLEIQDLPDAVVEELERRAAAQGVSMNDLVLAVLERIARRVESENGATPDGDAGPAEALLPRDDGPRQG